MSESGDRKTGRCPQCHNVRLVTKAGRMFRHSAFKSLGHARALGYCHGSGEKAMGERQAADAVAMSVE